MINFCLECESHSCSSYVSDFGIAEGHNEFVMIEYPDFTLFKEWQFWQAVLGSLAMSLFFF